MAEWQPIETIPKDRTRVLLWVPGSSFNGSDFVGGQWDGGAIWADDDCPANDATHWAVIAPPISGDSNGR